MLARMSETLPWVLVTLLAVCAVLLLWLVWAVQRGMARLERLLEKRGGSGALAAAVPAARKSRHDGEFEAFLKEDPSRQQLAKSDQFSAYRRWRREKGLNWAKP